MNSPDLFVGIDVQAKRGLPYCILDHHGAMVSSGRVQGNGGTDHARTMCDELRTAACADRMAIGTDAPRMPRPDARQWYWDGTRKRWRSRRPSDKGLGRRREVVVKALGLANPQWTPLIGESPARMRIGTLSVSNARSSLNAILMSLERSPHRCYTIIHTAPLRLYSVARDRPRRNADMTLHGIDFLLDLSTPEELHPAFRQEVLSEALNEYDAA